MKIFVLLFLLASIYLPQSCGQAGRSITKGYAYSRETLGGAAPTVKVDENGTASESVRRAAQQYYIYIEVPRPPDVTVKSVWIKGMKFDAGVTEVPSTPVVLSNLSVTMETDTLVPKTVNKVWQVVPAAGGSAASGAAVKAARTAAAADEVEIEYVYKGKTFRFPIHEIKKLHPVALQ